MIRLAFLGCGRVAQRHMEVCKNELQGAKVTVVCDPVQKLADQRANELGARALYSMDELLKSQDVDAICVLTESGKHSEHTRLILEAGKHAIVEKPPTMHVGEIHELQKLARDKKLMYAVILQNRYNPAMRALKNAFESGRFGKVVLATIRLRWCRTQPYYEDGWHGTWHMDGGVINQQAFHHVDALQWICGAVSDVCAAQANALNKLEAEDTTAAVLKMANGALGLIEATTAARPEDFEASISVVGEKGTVVVGGIALNRMFTWKFIETQPEDADALQTFSQEVPTGYGLSHGPLMQEIVTRLNAGRIDPPFTGEDAIPAIRLVHALYASTEQGGWVSLKDNPVSKRLGVRALEVSTR